MSDDAHAPKKQKTDAMAAKTVLITGANRGIGLEFAKHYTKEGWKVIVTARDVAGATELKALNPSKLLSLDTSNEQSILDAAKSLEGVSVDLLINNAGMLTYKNFETTDKPDLMRQFEVNVVGPFLMTRAMLPNLKAAVADKGEAFVVQLASRMGSITDNTSGGYYGYRASKTALNMISASLAHDLKSEKIGVLLLHPGYVATEMTKEMTESGALTPVESVAGLTKIIANATLEDSGKFTHVMGQQISW